MIELAIIVGMFLLIFLGVPISFSILAVSLLGLASLNGQLGIYNAALALFSGAVSFPLIAIPLFVLAGALMNTGGISRRLINFVSALVGFVRGGLAAVNVGVSLFFAEISGSAVADVAAIGSVMIPEMKRKKYGAHFSAAVTSSSASLAIIIPPSIPMILYGAMSNTSIVQLFIAGIIPGLMGGILMMGLCYYFAVRHNLPREEAFSLRRLGRATAEAGWALVLPVIILGGIFGGFVTATEGAALAVLAAFIIGFFIYREIRLPELWHALCEGVTQTAVVMLMVATSAVLGLYLTETQVPQRLAESLLVMTDSKILMLLMFNLLLFVIGTVMHGAAAIILTVPIFMPIVHQYGIDPVQFGLILTLNIAIGQQTPPVASVLATACSIAKTDMWETTKANLPFIGVLFAVLMVVTYIPSVPLLLVEIFYR